MDQQFFKYSVGVLLCYITFILCLFFLFLLFFFFRDSNSRFKESDAFVGFQKDTPASVIFQATALTRVDPDDLDARKEDVCDITRII